MKINSFNSKVNLPKFCAKLGYTDYQYIKLPTFGWYAYNRDRSFVGNIFDVVGQKDREYLYSIITKNKAEYLDFDLAFSDMAETQLKYNLLETQLWTAAFSFAKQEAQTHKMTYKGKKVLFSEILAAHGMSALLGNNVGIITQAVLEKFNMLPWPKKEIRGKVLIPSFCTPYHICSLEYGSWDKLNELYPLWLNDEKGWYGNIKHKQVISNIKELSTNPGNTWDAKADYWYGQDVVQLSDFLDVSDCIRIWTESNQTAFNKSPLQHIIDSGATVELKNHVAKLSFNQLQELESLTGEKLGQAWKKARETQVQIGSRIFVKRDNCYFVYKKGNLQQVTNFAIDIEKIVKTGTKFRRTGLIHFGNQTVPFEMDEKYFTTTYMFHRGIKDKFLNAGLGVPIIHPDFFNKALLIIDSFNAGTKIELGDNEPKPTTSQPT